MSRNPSASRLPSVRYPGVLFVPNSEAAKIAGCSCTYLSRQTCSDQCPLKDDGCYGNGGHVRLHTPKNNPDLSADDIILNECAILSEVSYVYDPLRLHVVGDATTALHAMALRSATAHWDDPVFTYTHSWRFIERKWWGDISVFASCETQSEASQAMLAGYAAVMVVEKFQGAKWKAGPFKAIACPHQTESKLDCIRCGLCFEASERLKKQQIIAFEPHGSQAKAVRNIVRTKENQ
jgi:hypothetical protein